MKTLMNAVKINATFTGSNFNINFCEAPLEGETFKAAEAAIIATKTLDLTTLPASIFVDCPAARHGIKQKLVDSLAMNKSVKEVTTVRQSVDILNDLIKQLQDGNWNSPTKAGKSPSISLNAMELQFLAGVMNGTVPYDQAAALYNSITGKVLPKLESNPE